MVAFAGAAMDMLTLGAFLLLVTGTRHCVFTTHSPHSNVEQKLVRPHNEKSVTISLAKTKYNNTTQISAAGLGDNVTIVSRGDIRLAVLLIFLFRIEKVLAAFRAGKATPVLVSKYKNIVQTDFVYNRSGQRRLHWPLIRL